MSSSLSKIFLRRIAPPARQPFFERCVANVLAEELSFPVDELNADRPLWVCCEFSSSFAAIAVGFFAFALGFFFLGFLDLDIGAFT